MEYEYILTPDGELYHWGIKGMKWGQRRYQNKDGSLTPAGKKRYAKEEAELKEREKLIKNREREAARRAKLDSKKAELDARENALSGDKKVPTAKDTGKAKPKSVKDMSDEELNEAIQRARMEDAYRNLRPEPTPKPKFSKKLLDEAIKPALINSGRKAAESIIDKTVKDLLKDKVDPNSLAGIEAANKKLAAQLENKLLKMGINPNIKSENLSKWKEFNKTLKDEEEAAKQAKKDAKAKKAQEKADAKAAKKAERDEWNERFNRENEAVDAEYEKVERDIHEQQTSLVPYNSEQARRGREYANRYANDEYVLIVNEDGTTTIVRRDDL